MFYLIILLLVGMNNVMFSAEKKFLGFREFVCEDQQRIFDQQKRRLEIAVWYPTKQQSPIEKIDFGIWKIKDVVRNAALEDKRLPLIIFSHGYSGNQWTNTWFAEQLAENGYMVAIVRHYGNSYKNMIPEICARPWNRAQDLSCVLDYLLQSNMKEHIDTNRIGAAGFSQGGVACMWIAGVRASLSPENVKKQITVVNNPQCRELHFKEISQERLNRVLDNFTDQDFKEANKLYYDSRFKAVFVIAPGIDEENIMFKPEGLSQSKIPMYIIVGESDEGTVGQSQFFAQHIPQSKLTIISGHVGHMTLLNEGTAEGKIRKPEYTVDHPSVDRKKVHVSVASEALSFFNTCFKKT